jgi:hypothetical protein
VVQVQATQKRTLSSRLGDSGRNQPLNLMLAGNLIVDAPGPSFFSQAICSPAYGCVARLLCIPGDTLALRFGGSRSLDEITTDQMRSFADAARIPASRSGRLRSRSHSALSRAGKRSNRRTCSPKEMRASIEKQILRVAATTK